MLNNITPVVISYNEQANIERTLQQLSWAGNVVVMDSFSTDQTQSICQQFSNVTFVQREFDDFSNQCAAAVSHPSINTNWVLSMDADYLVSASFIQELTELEPNDGVDAYRASFVYCINGGPIGDSLYPPRIVLALKEKLSFRMDGHAHRRSVPGQIKNLT